MTDELDLDLMAALDYDHHKSTLKVVYRRKGAITPGYITRYIHRMRNPKIMFCAFDGCQNVSIPIGSSYIKKYCSELHSTIASNLRSYSKNGKIFNAKSKAKRKREEAVKNQLTPYEENIFRHRTKYIDYPGIYFFMRGKEVVNVGVATTNVIDRINSKILNVASKKNWNYTHIEYVRLPGKNKKELFLLEKKLIKKYDPEYNLMCTERGSKIQSDTRKRTHAEKNNNPIQAQPRSD